MKKQFDHDDWKKSKAWLYKLILAFLGMIVSFYLIIHYLDVVSLGETLSFCNVNKLFNCDTVALSQYSQFLNIPLAVWGFAYFVASASLLAIVYYRRDLALIHYQTYQVLVTVGVLASVVMFFISYAHLKTFCIGCLVVYFLTLIQFALLFYFRSFLNWRLCRGTYRTGFATLLINVFFVITVFSFLMGFCSRPDAKNRPKKETENSSYEEQSSPGESVQFSRLSERKKNIPLHRTRYSKLGEDYRKGNENAQLIVTVFFDMMCGHCRYFYTQILSKLIEIYGDRVLFVMKNYPLGVGESYLGFYGALLARCAGLDGKFYLYLDKLFSLPSITKTVMNEVATSPEVGLSNEQIMHCSKDKRMVAKILDNKQVGNEEPERVTGTPSIFFNGRKYLSHGSLEINRLSSVIESLLDSDINEE